MDINNLNSKVSPENSGLPLRVESNDNNARLKAIESDDSSDDNRDERRHKKRKKDRKRSRDRDDDRRRSKKDRDERSRSRDRYKSERGRDGSRDKRDDSRQRDRDRRSRSGDRTTVKSSDSAIGEKDVGNTTSIDDKSSDVNDSNASNLKRETSRDRRRDDRRDSRDRDRRRRSRSRSGDRRYRGDDRSRRDDSRRDDRRDDRGGGGGSRRSYSRDRRPGSGRSDPRSGSTGRGGGGSGTADAPAGASSSGAASSASAGGASAENGGLKPVTLRDIMNANPGISMPEAVVRLNNYNTALARGETPPPLSGALTMNSGPAILPLGLAHLNGTTLGAVTSAAGVSLGEGGAATRPHREIYVGNLPPGITVPQLSEFLNGAMKQMGISKDGQNSVITAWVAPDGHFAFAEVRTIEEANAAMLHLNGVQCGQFALRIGRPKGYNGMGSAVPAMGGPSASLGALAGINPLLAGMSGGVLGLTGIPGFAAGVPGVAGEPLSNVIMCSNLSVLIGEDEIKELFKPFGELKAFNLIRTLNGQTQSVALEYVIPELADIVVQGMNKLEIAGLKLLVQKVPQSSANLLLTPAVKESTQKPTSAPTTSAPAAPNASGASAQPSAGSSASAVDAPAAVPATKDPLKDHPPSSVIRLSNMTTAEDLTNDESYNDLLEDVADECNTHGAVKSIIIPRGFDASRGQIFVHFVNVSDAQRCLQAVQGRRFNGKIVHGVYYPEQLFINKTYVVPSDFVIGMRGGTRRQQVDMDTLD